MNWPASTVGVVAAVGLAAACSPPAVEQPARLTIRVSYSGLANFGDLPSQLAHERLRAQGYVIEEAYYSATDVAIDALRRGDADIGVGSITGAWTAALRSAPIRTIMEHIANPHRLVAAPGFEGCEGLGRSRLAVPGEAGVVTDLIRVYLAEACPGARPTTVYIQGSDNRAAALLAGSIDASGIEVGMLDWLETQVPGRFRVVADFAARWPLIKTTGVQVNLNFAAARPDAVLDYLRARLAANRDFMARPDLAVSEAMRVLGPSDRWPRVAETYINAGAWAIDGGLTEADVARTLAFFANDALGRASPRDVSDLGFLAKALGRAN